jgi:hypothetical protein
MCGADEVPRQAVALLGATTPMQIGQYRRGRAARTDPDPRASISTQ